MSAAEAVPDEPDPPELAPVTADPAGTQLRSVLREFPTGITVVTAVVDGVCHAMTANAFCSVSLEPPQVLVCVAHSTRFHAAIEAAGQWAVSILGEHQSGLATHFATTGRDLATQFDGIPNRAGSFTGAPLLTGAQAWLECRTSQTVIAGDHTIVVADVLAAGANATGLAPLAYHRGRYASPRPAGATQSPTDAAPRTTRNQRERGAS
jgi:flavin reductase